MEKIYKVRGMHCRSCEILLEENIGKISGVKKVNASTRKGEVKVKGDFLEKQVLKAIKKAGYHFGDRFEEPANANLIRDIIIAAVILLGLFIFGKLLGIEKILTPGGSTVGGNLLTVFVIGLTAGFSTCMALVGGLVLGISARFAENHPNASPFQKFKPHLYFNLGRIGAYFLLGGVIGYLGSALKFSNNVLGILMILVSIMMVLMGIQLLEIYPRLKFSLIFPKKIVKFFNLQPKKSQSKLKTGLAGAMTFFLPCGFTQAMQLYAVTTGKFVSGALIMGVFAVGTTPGLLGIGGLTAIIKKGRLGNIFFKVAGLLVILLAFYNISNGWRLIRFDISRGNKETKTESWEIVGSNNKSIQVIKGTYDNQTVLEPEEYSVDVGAPVRFEIYAKEDGQGCMGSIVIPGLADEPQFFQKDQTVVFEFTPQKRGKYRITCAMGLQEGIIVVK